MLRIKLVFAGLMLIAVIGCNKSKKENTVQPSMPAPQPTAIPATIPPQPPPPATIQTQKPTEPTKAEKLQKEIVKPTKKLAISKPDARPVPAAEQEVSQDVSEAVPGETAPVEPQKLNEPEAPREKQPEYVVIPNGIYLKVRLQSPLDTTVNIAGDTFRAILDQDIQVNGKIVAPRGAVFEGKVSQAERSGRVQGRAAMSLQLVNLIFEGTAYPLQTEILNFTAESSTKKDAGKVGIGAGIGAVIGAIAGGGKGAAIGAAVGGGAGGATVLATRGNEVKLEAERQLNFELQRDIRIKLP